LNFEYWISEQRYYWNKGNNTQKAIITAAIMAAGSVWMINLAIKGIKWILKQ